MTENELRLLARSLRVRAAEVLVKAETMIDADARQMMLDVAASYERLAQRLEDSA